MKSKPFLFLVLAFVFLIFAIVFTFWYLGDIKIPFLSKENNNGVSKREEVKRKASLEEVSKALETANAGKVADPVELRAVQNALDQANKSSANSQIENSNNSLQNALDAAQKSTKERTEISKAMETANRQ